MHGEGFFYQAFVYLTAAVITVPIAKRLGLGSVLGYLLAGIAIGPFCLGLIGEEGQDVMHFAEFGVVMMLFLIGLELEPAVLWRLRGPILGLGGLQVGGTTAVGALIGIALGLPWNVAIAVGMILALSSTAIVLQTLHEKGLMNTGAGKSSFAVLLFQDVAVIPMIAIMPLLALGDKHGSGVTEAAEHGAGTVGTLPAWAQTLSVLGAVALVVVAGRYLVRPAFRIIARTRLREIFAAAALMLIIGIALLMAKVGLSPALGTFLAGVLLASSEYRHELESNIETFKGLLLGLFFITVGTSIDFWLVATQPGLILGLLGGLILVKFIVLFVLGRLFKMGLDQNLLFAVALAQSGEFAFVLFSFATQDGVLGAEIAGKLVAVVALSMALTPLLMLLNEKWIQPRFGTKEQDDRQADTIDQVCPVIIVGFGRFGHIVGRLLSANGVNATVLDVDSDHVDLLRKLGLKVFYGDASRHDLLHSAGVEQAKLLVVAIDDEERTLRIAETARKNFPHLTIFARARGRAHAYELLEAGVDHVYRETLDTSLVMGVDVLRKLGFRSYQALRSARTFRRHDEEQLRELCHMRHDRKAYIDRARQAIQDLETILRDELAQTHDSGDGAWDVDSLLQELGGGKPAGDR